MLEDANKEGFAYGNTPVVLRNSALPLVVLENGTACLHIHIFVLVTYFKRTVGCKQGAAAWQFCVDALI